MGSCRWSTLPQLHTDIGHCIRVWTRCLHSCLHLHAYIVTFWLRSVLLKLPNSKNQNPKPVITQINCSTDTICNLQKNTVTKLSNSQQKSVPFIIFFSMVFDLPRCGPWQDPATCFLLRVWNGYLWVSLEVQVIVCRDGHPVGQPSFLSLVQLRLDPVVTWHCNLDGSSWRLGPSWHGCLRTA